MMQIAEYATRAAAFADLAGLVEAALAEDLAAQDHAALAVPGGTTPGPVFDLLAGADLPWDRVHVLLTDERWVPEDHERSNAGLLRRRLLVNRAAAARFEPVYDGTDPGSRVAVLGAQMQPLLPLSVLVLGMGADMHTASLFPGVPGLGAALAADAPALVVLAPPDQPEIRVSLSAPVLNAARRKHLVIFGAEKRAALEAAQTLPADEAPIRAVMDDLVVHWAE